MSSDLNIENRLVAALRRISHAIDLYSRTLVHEHGLTAPQLAALQSVGRLQPVSVSAVARDVHLSVATVTGIFNRLEHRALVRRSRGGKDRRTVVVDLTDAGWTLLETAPSLLQDRFRGELARLQRWEQTQLLASLQRVASMMDAEGLEATPVPRPENVTASPGGVSQYSSCFEKAVAPTEARRPNDFQKETSNVSQAR